MDVVMMSAEDNGISMEDVIVFRISDRHCKIAPPTKDDPVEMRALKNFIMACLQRRNLDENFEAEMHNWLSGCTLSEFKEAVERHAPPPRKN